MYSKIIIILVGTILLQTWKVNSVNDLKLIRTEPIPNEKIVNLLKKNIPLDNLEHVQLLSAIEVNNEVDVLISPTFLPNLVAVLDNSNMKYEIVNKNCRKLLHAERDPEKQIPLQNTDQLSWKKYNNYEALAAVGRHTSGAVVKTEEIGKTFEKRPIKLVKVTNGDNNEAIPAIWLDGGVHGREWISVATVTYILKMLVLGEPQSKELLAAFNWYIVPVVNVDGYAYTWDSTEDRKWRRNRKKTGILTKGVDLNRNFSVGWGIGEDSDSTFNETYRGPRASSEIETEAICNAILQRQANIKMYLSFHSYSQLILIPWGHQFEQADDYDDLWELANVGKSAIEDTYGTEYRVGTAAKLLGKLVGGASDDWAKREAKIKYSYTFELRGTAQNAYGFSLPTNQIIPCGDETFNGVSAMALALAKKF